MLRGTHRAMCRRTESRQRARDGRDQEDVLAHVDDLEGHSRSSAFEGEQRAETEALVGAGHPETLPRLREGAPVEVVGVGQERLVAEDDEKRREPVGGSCPVGIRGGALGRRARRPGLRGRTTSGAWPPRIEVRPPRGRPATRWGRRCADTRQPSRPARGHATGPRRRRADARQRRRGWRRTVEALASTATAASRDSTPVARVHVSTLRRDPRHGRRGRAGWAHPRGSRRATRACSRASGEIPRSRHDIPRRRSDLVRVRCRSRTVR
jgi:hypothetical protein